MSEQGTGMGVNGSATILTASGRFVDVKAPDPKTLVLEDMAHALGYLCRFTGHTRRFYSVAEHLVRGVAYVSERNRLAWLLHDAAEAYMGDMASPLKRQVWSMEYRRYEEWLHTQIWAKFGARDREREPAEVRQVDRRMLATEMRNLLPGRKDWKPESLAEPLAEVILAVAAPKLDLEYGCEWLYMVQRERAKL